MVTWEILDSVYKTMKVKVDRLILGYRIFTSERKSQPRKNIWSENDTISGSIGFLDFQIRERAIIKKEVYERRLRDSNFEVLTSLTVLDVGIEPEFQGKKYFKEMMNIIEVLALENKCKCIVLDSIETAKVLSWALQRWYKPFDEHAVKYL